MVNFHKIQLKHQQTFLFVELHIGKFSICLSFRGDLVPGKLVPQNKLCYIPSGNQEHRYSAYQALSFDKKYGNIQWVASANGSVPEGSVQGGLSDQGSKFYIGRVNHNGIVTPGKIDPRNKCIYISSGNKEFKYSNYEVLVTTQPIGIKATLSKKGLLYARDYAYKIIQDQVMNRTLEIPDVSGSQSVPLIGTVHFNVTKIELKNIHVDLPELTISEDYGVLLNIQRIQGLITFAFSYTNRGMVRGQGTGRVNLRRMSLMMKLGMSEVESGHPQFSLYPRDFSFRILDWAIDLNGPGWFVQLMKNLFNGRIKSEVENSVRNGVRDAIYKQINPEIRKQPLVQNIPNTDVGMDLRFRIPSIKQDYISLHLKGGFVNSRNGDQATIINRRLPNILDTSKMIHFILSDYVPNSLFEMAYKTGLLKGNLTDEKLPEWSPYRLNSSSLIPIVPNLQMHFPNRKILVENFVNTSPRFDFDTSALKGVMKGSSKWYAIQDKDLKHAFTLDLEVSFQMNLFIRDSSLCGKIPSFTVKLNVKESNVGVIRSISALETMFGYFSNYILLPSVNLLLDIGYQLPSPGGIKLENPLIKFEPHFMFVSADIKLPNPK